MRIVFDHLPEPYNLNSREHWGVRQSATRKAQKAVDRAFSGHQRPAIPYATVDMHFHFLLPNLRVRDLGVLRENLKPYVDYLCRPMLKKDGTVRRPGLSIIEDDRMTCLVSELVTWELRRDQPGFYMDIQPRG